MLQLWPVWTLPVGLTPTKEIEVNGTISNPTLWNRVSTLRWKPLSQICPQFQTTKRLLSQESVSKSDSKPTTARTSALNDPTSAFKKDGTAIIYKTEESPVRLNDPSLPMSEESTPGTARMHLLFELEAVQTLPTWILTDAG